MVGDLVGDAKELATDGNERCRSLRGGGIEGGQGRVFGAVVQD